MKKEYVENFEYDEPLQSEVSQLTEYQFKYAAMIFERFAKLISNMGQIGREIFGDEKTGTIKTIGGKKILSEEGDKRAIEAYYLCCDTHNALTEAWGVLDRGRFDLAKLVWGSEWAIRSLNGHSLQKAFSSLTAHGEQIIKDFIDDLYGLTIRVHGVGIDFWQAFERLLDKSEERSSTLMELQENICKFIKREL